MGTKKQLKEYIILAKVTLEIEISVEAADLEDALNIGHAKKVIDLLEVKGTHVDSALEVIGVYQSKT